MVNKNLVFEVAEIFCVIYLLFGKQRHHKQLTRRQVKVKRWSSSSFSGKILN